MKGPPDYAHQRDARDGSLFVTSRFEHTTMDLRETLRKLWRRKAIIVGTVCVMVGFAILIISQLTPRYTAHTLVRIDSDRERVVDVDAVLSGLPADIETIESEVQVIRSRDLATRTIQKLGLEKMAEFNPTLRKPSSFDIYTDPATYLPEAWLSAFVVSDPVGPTLSAEELAQRNWDNIVDGFLGKLRVGPVGRSRVIRISFESTDPVVAANVANTVADFYIVSQLEAKFDATERANLWLTERLEELRAKVEVSEAAVETYRKKAGLIAGKDVVLTAQEVSEFASQLVVARTARAEAEARLQQVEVLLAGGGTVRAIGAVGEVLDSPLIQRLRQEQAALTRKQAELSEEFGERHPRMMHVRAEIDDMRSQLAIEVDKIVERLRNEVAVARARENSLGTSVAALKQDVARLNNAEVKLRGLQREADANRTLFETFLLRSKETGAQEGFEQPDAYIISESSIPRGASYPNKKLLLLFVLVGSSALGVGLAYVVENLDQGYRSSEQVEESMGVAPLGLIPALTKLGRLRGTPEAYILKKPASVFGEAIRSLHTNLMLSDVDRPPKVVLIGSAVSNEGKTSVAVSLGRMLARFGRRVVLIDCDLRKPSAHTLLKLQPRPGLVEHLSRGASLEDVMQTDTATGLRFISAGAPAPNPPDVLSSEQMKELMSQLSDMFDMVIIDTSPVMAVADTVAMARLVDKIVFVVRWAETRRETANTAVKRLIDAGGDVAGAVLSLVDVKKHAQYGYGDSSSYYGSAYKYYTE